MGKFHVVYFGSNDVPVDLIKPILWPRSTPT